MPEPWGARRKLCWRWWRGSWGPGRLLDRGVGVRPCRLGLCLSPLDGRQVRASCARHSDIIIIDCDSGTQGCWHAGSNPGQLPRRGKFAPATPQDFAKHETIFLTYS